MLRGVKAVRKTRATDPRRGIAIEMAILVILITAALSIILLTNSIQESRFSKRASTELSDRIDQWEIGELALAYSWGDGQDSFTHGDYLITRLNGIGEDYTLEIKKDSEPLLIITVNDGEITSWNPPRERS